MSHALRLSPEEQVELCAKAKQGDIPARDRLVRSMLALVYKIARSVRIPRGTEVDDIAQAGVISLLRAIEKYDPAREVKFSTYATHWIWSGVGAALYQARGWRKSDAHRMKIADHYRAGLAEGLSDKEATTRAAEHFGTREATVRAVHAALYRVEVSLEAPAGRGRDGAASTLTLGDMLADPSTPIDEEIDERTHRRRVRSILHAFRAGLRPRDLQILDERILDDEKTLEEIGSDHGISRERVRQLEANLRMKLRARLVDNGFSEEPGAAPVRRTHPPRVASLEQEDANRTRSRNRQRIIRAGLCGICGTYPLAWGLSRTRCIGCLGGPRTRSEDQTPTDPPAKAS